MSVREWVLSDATLPQIFEDVPGKPYWRAGQVIGYRVFTARGQSEVAMFGDRIKCVGGRWFVMSAEEKP